VPIEQPAKAKVARIARIARLRIRQISAAYPLAYLIHFKSPNADQKTVDLSNNFKMVGAEGPEPSTP
jgi:hypothetical protein